ncbi:hypothetical protein [Xanthomonas vesicatoria]|uniref:hypothetical protein n=1 Tax=Xanthomonas vesicatoria TaxID=56460 RepID=UPI0002ED2250|nr:hypothetical protein [Xanthomonas vesicatoria]MCC8558883.1 hypothetical protein [Xanthomonas vesicatoria]MCC8596488.1 hypothetical protein [Xanthomonas vesicatoria]MCC8607219.1 hypothetical protein [Xanthomonas vesicatoria]MCC8610606.1 hypothetical protein [Xanthomonas vesicatoria]MCC8674446.1 hypothetical protein [Xanthomonas vesicatoria]
MTWLRIVRGRRAHFRVSNWPLLLMRRISSDDNGAMLALRSAFNRLASWPRHARHQKSY